MLHAATPPDSAESVWRKEVYRLQLAWVSSQPGASVPDEGRVDEDALEVQLEPSSDLDLGACQLCELG